MDLSDAGKGPVIGCSKHGNAEKITDSERLCSME